MGTNERPTYPDNLPSKQDGKKSGKGRSVKTDRQSGSDKSGDGDNSGQAK